MSITSAGVDVTTEDFGEAVALVTVAIVEALSADGEQTSERLESVAGRLLDTLREFDAIGPLPGDWSRQAVRAVANILVKSEIDWPRAAP